MTVKRMITEKEREILRQSEKGKKNPSELTRKDLDNLIIILAQKAGLL